MRKTFLLSLFLLSLFVSSCDSKRVFDEYKSVPNHWNKDSVISFTVHGLDTAQTYNLFINIRNNNQYQYSNLFLITEMNFPNGKVIADTLEYEMAYPDGSWMGEGFSNIKENKLWYKENVRFSEIGTYKINIRQAMRQNGEVEGIENLKGITEVGFRIEKSNL